VALGEVIAAADQAAQRLAAQIGTGERTGEP
jgi:hypothetical protein